MKAICAFLIVCIHIPFLGQVGEYFTALTRVAVPIFFMITGFFYSETIKRHKEKQQIRKILRLLVGANILYFVWKLMIGLIQRELPVSAYIRSVFSTKNLVKFLIFNDSPVGGHLWYLGAIFYVLVIVLLMDNLKCRKVLCYLTLILLLVDLMFGKYSLLIFHREFPYILVRNFLCVGVPYFCIGNLIREKYICFEKLNKSTLRLLIIFFALTSLIERFLLVNAGLNATRDHYISTTFLAICLFVYALKSNWENKGVAVIGRKYSTGLYITHPIFITIFAMVTEKLGVKSVYRNIAPIVVYCATLIFLVIIQKIKVGLRRK